MLKEAGEGVEKPWALELGVLTFCGTSSGFCRDQGVKFLRGKLDSM